MKYALIGCGRISTNHIKAAVANNLEIVAVCDVIPERMEEVLAKHGLENDKSILRYTDYKKTDCRKFRVAAYKHRYRKRKACRNRVVLYRTRYKRYHRKTHGNESFRRG